MRIFSVKKRIMTSWQEESLKDKIHLLMGLVFTIFIILAAVNIWTIKISVLDFRYSLSSNEKVGNVVEALEKESSSFKSYMKGDLSEEEFKAVNIETDRAIEELPFDYKKMGEERFSWTQTIKSAYSAYSEKRAKYIGYGNHKSVYIRTAYKLYDMQEYLNVYANTLMSLTSEDLNSFYQARFPVLAGFIIVIVIVAILLLLSMVKISGLLNKTLTEPVVKLVDASKEIAKNNYDIDDIVVENRDEIGELVHAFNKMKYVTGKYITTLEDNRIALDKLHAEEMQKKEVENQLEKMKLEALRNQINPHFLFNTLNVISGMASLEDAEVTEKMIKALSSLFRYMLRTETKETTLEQEVELIKDYMYLQKMRFGQRIQFEIECPQELFDVYVPTFTIQPIVENSIVHGLSKKEEGGIIKITAIERSPEILELIIADTGVGMTPEELKTLLNKLDDSDLSRKGIGVGNIYRRLRLMYESSSFVIQSEKNVGTRTIIQIPLKREND